MSRRKKKSGAMWVIVIIVAFICVLLFVKTTNLNKQLNNQKEQLAGINSEIELARDKTEEIKDEIRYRETDDYIEDKARESLGLRYPDEIILVPEQTQD